MSNQIRALTLEKFRSEVAQYDDRGSKSMLARELAAARKIEMMDRLIAYRMNGTKLPEPLPTWWKKIVAKRCLETIDQILDSTPSKPGPRPLP